MATETQEKPELDLLRHWEPEGARNVHRRAALWSLLAHAVFLLLVWVLPEEAFRSSFVRELGQVELPRQRTPLIAPTKEILEQLTQKAPNTKPLQKEVTLEELAARNQITAPNSPSPSPEIQGQRRLQSTNTPAMAAPAPKGPEPAKTPETQPKQRSQELAMDAPQAVDTKKDPTLLAQAGVPTGALPQIQAVEKPKLQLETLGQQRSNGTAPAGAKGASGQPEFRLPKNTVEEALRSSMKGGTGAAIVMETYDLPSSSQGGFGGIFSPQQSSPGRVGSTLELLSDPQGVDFKPYLIRVLAMVKRNWFSVMPESARLGQRGRTVLQFSIDRQGRVPKLVIANPAGTDALDRAAVAGISASVPFPELPPDFKGQQVRLQLSFLYNMPR
jgi:TonB family protein